MHVQAYTAQIALLTTDIFTMIKLTDFLGLFPHSSAGCRNDVTTAVALLHLRAMESYILAII